MATVPIFARIQNMIAQLTGKIAFLDPTRVILNVNGVGYDLQVSLYTYAEIQGKQEVTLHTYLKVAEDSLTFFGFSALQEKEMFIKLIGISGVGAATARMMLSSLRPAEIASAILAGNAGQLERVKGIGKKTAERLVLELKDKMGKMGDTPGFASLSEHNTIWTDALDALVTLGIPKSATEMAIKRLQKDDRQYDSVEEIIKQVLKSL